MFGLKTQLLICSEVHCLSDFVFFFFVVLLIHNKRIGWPTRQLLAFLCFLLVFHVAPPSGTHPSQQSINSAPRLPAPSLQDKHQRLSEHFKDSTFPPHHPTSCSTDPHLSHCHDDNHNKPKGKCPFKTKHTENTTKEEVRNEEGSDDEEIRGKVSCFLFLKHEFWLNSYWSFWQKENEVVYV